MKAKTKRTIGNIFASLIKNDRAIEGAKTSPWWVAVILFLVGTFLPVIPIMTTAGNSYGSSFLKSYTYGYEQGLTSTCLSLQEDGYEFTINENKKLVLTKGTETISQTWVEADGKVPDETAIASYTAIREGKSEVAFEIYYTDREYNKGTKTVNSLIKTIEARQYVKDTTDLYVEVEGEETPTLYTPSYLILYKDGYYSKVYKTDTTTAYSNSYKGNDWSHFESNIKLLEMTLNIEGFDKNANDSNYVDAVKKAWSEVFNKGYLAQKQLNFWFSSGLYYGIYIVLGLFMGLMIWLLTRGKKNPNRGLKLGTAIAISGWIDVTPGLLAMILAFIWTQAAGIAYIVLIGMRAMWLSMRQLNPQTVQ